MNRWPEHLRLQHLGSALLGLGGLLLLADLLGRAAGWRALGTGPHHSAQVALTFDDGPSPRTLELLEILARHGAHATFFVTAPATQKHPELIEALLAAGHQVEAHGRWHVHALRLTPWQEWQQIRWHPRARQRGPHLYRPPYGGHSPLTRLIGWFTHRQVTLWDVESRDWTDADADTIARLTLQATRPGSVILLHDGPAVTPTALELLLSGLSARQLQAVTLNDLPIQRLTLRDSLGRFRGSYGAH